jgi:hypothetical protein
MKARTLVRNCARRFRSEPLQRHRAKTENRAPAASFFRTRPKVHERLQLEAILLVVGKARRFSDATVHVVEPRCDRAIDVNSRGTRQPTHVYGLQPGHEFAAADGVEAIAPSQKLFRRHLLIGEYRRSRRKSHDLRYRQENNLNPRTDRQVALQTVSRRPAGQTAHSSHFGIK